jgi:hypothetical protein
MFAIAPPAGKIEGMPTKATSTLPAIRSSLRTATGAWAKVGMPPFWNM